MLLQHLHSRHPWRSDSSYDSIGTHREIRGRTAKNLWHSRFSLFRFAVRPQFFVTGPSAADGQRHGPLTSAVPADAGPVSFFYNGPAIPGAGRAACGESYHRPCGYAPDLLATFPGTRDTATESHRVVHRKDCATPETVPVRLFCRHGTCLPIVPPRPTSAPAVQA